MRLKNYGRNQKKRKEYIETPFSPAKAGLKGVS